MADFHKSQLFDILKLISSPGFDTMDSAEFLNRFEEMKRLRELRKKIQGKDQAKEGRQTGLHIDRP